MRKFLAGSPWGAAFLSWFLAAGIVSGVYLLWVTLRGGVIQWSIIRDAALMAAPIALFRAWRDSGRRG
ncbi:MAG TPA: hypothetical protein VD969_05010 [Symbiobacteriaceae bacterium]|nr:hypothetical protein [Symbiobacteriaceae bacterium]